MAYDSYKLAQSSTSSIKNRMLDSKKRQIDFLYTHACDREDNTLLNGKEFVKSPRIFDRKFIDTIHHKITVETILEEDWMECGDYLEYDGMVWLCMNSYSFHKLYCRATFMSCDWKIYWINENGELVSQYVVDQNSTQYNSGEYGNSIMTLGSAQHMLRMQCNDNTVMLDSPQRFAIDRNIKKPTCYKITQNDNSAYNYGKGLCCITVTETQLNHDTDKLITLDDGKKVWVCDYTEPSTPLPPPSSSDEMTVLIQGKKELKCGYKRTYTALLFNKDGNTIDWDDTLYGWNVVSDFNVGQTIIKNRIELDVDNEDLIGSSFLLQVVNLNDNSVIEQIKITVVEGF